MEIMFLFTHLIMAACVIVIIRTVIPFRKPSFGPVHIFLKKKRRVYARKQPDYVAPLQNREPGLQIAFTKLHP
ncbi:hypothetical protein KXD93_06570 [Mucilaginibacter sp. BJC16-A38]|uniref:hypothetical protein n=1 Tax=Mucilaginibacter phenanthrenivorans TaxID=1234842 RepID=UPI002157D137|nr:hypothetical protein [Mucilaginibacter phenanthrenivorans]MCR8557296.1 hypothetical protein [Mucilaginibacter phenanthrenivorans]